MLKVSRVGVISKEGDHRSKTLARLTAKLLLDCGIEVTSYPNLRMRRVEHVSGVKEIGRSRMDIIITFSGDGTILRLIRSLNSTIPCLCVNVGGRGILAEIRPEQVEKAIEQIVSGDFTVERRLRILPKLGTRALSPALNEVMLVRKSFAKTPSFTIELGHHARFSQRMDGLIVTTPTGSTGHSFSYGSPFLEGTISALILTPLAPIHRFPAIVMDPTNVQVTADFALELVIDGQETFRVEKDVAITFRRHSRDAVFIRLQMAGPYRQLSNLINLEGNPDAGRRKV